MKRTASEVFDDVDSSEAKRQRRTDNNVVGFDYLPPEIWTENIIPYCLKEWFSVSKELYHTAIRSLFKYQYSKSISFRLNVIKYGHTETLKLLLDSHYINEVSNLEFEKAIKKNQLQTIRILIQHYYNNQKIIKMGSLLICIVSWSRYYNPNILVFLIQNFNFAVEAKQYLLNSAQCDDVYSEILPILLEDNEVNPFVLGETIISVCASLKLNHLVAKLLMDDRIYTLNTIEFERVLTKVTAKCTLDTFKVLIQRVKCATVQLREGLRSATKGGNVSVAQHLLSMQIFSKDDLKGVFSDACMHRDNVCLVKQLLLDPQTDPSENDNLPIRNAVDNQAIEIVEILLLEDRVDPTTNNNKVLELTLSTDDLAILRLLLRSSKFDNINHFELTKLAVMYGALEIMKWLLETYSINPTLEDNELLCTAVLCERLDIVKYMLQDPRIDPSICHNRAILIAKDEDFQQMIELLMADPRVNPLKLDQDTLLNQLEEQRKLKMLP